MTKEQIKILKTLGFEDTVEDGAILQGHGLREDHKVYTGIDFIWEEDTFEDVLKRYAKIHTDMHMAIQEVKKRLL